MKAHTGILERDEGSIQILTTEGLGTLATTNGQLVGTVRHSQTFVDVVVPRADSRIGFVMFSAVLNDVDAKGVTGANFSPVAG